MFHVLGFSAGINVDVSFYIAFDDAMDICIYEAIDIASDSAVDDKDASVVFYGVRLFLVVSG